MAETMGVIKHEVSEAMASNLTPRCEFNAEDLILRLETTFPADVTKVSPMVEQVMDLAQEMDCTTGKEFEIETALREALANAIVHGCKQDPSHKIQLCVECDQSRVRTFTQLGAVVFSSSIS